MPIITLAVLVLIMTIGTRRFFTLSNITGMVEQGSTLLVMGLGETFIILLGSIDLSIAAVAALVTIITAMLIPIPRLPGLPGRLPVRRAAPAC